MPGTLTCNIPDIIDLPLDAELYIDESESALIKRLGIKGEPASSVSAFNSSI
jgi:hypothetical protein